MQADDAAQLLRKRRDTGGAVCLHCERWRMPQPTSLAPWCWPVGQHRAQAHFNHRALGSEGGSTASRSDPDSGDSTRTGYRQTERQSPESPKPRTSRRMGRSQRSHLQHGPKKVMRLVSPMLGPLPSVGSRGAHRAPEGFGLSAQNDLSTRSTDVKLRIPRTFILRAGWAHSQPDMLPRK
jgi:hypothetical protein